MSIVADRTATYQSTEFPLGTASPEVSGTKLPFMDSWSVTSPSRHGQKSTVFVICDGSSIRTYNANPSFPSMGKLGSGHGRSYTPYVSEPEPQDYTEPEPDISHRALALAKYALARALMQPAAAPLLRLLAVPEDYDDEFLEPTMYALRRTAALLTGVTHQLKGQLPHLVATTIGDGGVRLEFQRGSRHVRLVIGPHPDSKSYVYHELGDDYASERDVTQSTLVVWLEWAIEG